ncbi:hypothetical protein E6Q11_03180 [Candidatus Dojkabacteria bacterium]|uniref:Uncharacterized protein n=1 Tax=Candidatus Dojkabacteria bacterium TaxID=2099670 RepID=A0A5C7J6L3_9BACT|nr:MAG: hypothetical protein E6Q11_03180 [Candidatus Dojkabacteria bacterium]
MAIAFDASASGVSSSSPLTFNHTCTGSSLYFFVVTTPEATAITYNGVSCALTTSYTPTLPPGTNCLPIKVWTLPNPSTGTNTVSVTFTGAGVTACSASYTGTDTTYSMTSNVQTIDSNNVRVVTFTDSVTTQRDNSWVLGFVTNTGLAKTLSAGAGTTMRVNNQGSLNSSGLGVFDNNTNITPPATTALVFDVGPTSEFMTSVMYELPIPETTGVGQMIIL